MLKRRRSLMCCSWFKHGRLRTFVWATFILYIWCTSITQCHFNVLLVMGDLPKIALMHFASMVIWKRFGLCGIQIWKKWGVFHNLNLTLFTLESTNCWAPPLQDMDRWASVPKILYLSRLVHRRKLRYKSGGPVSYTHLTLPTILRV